MATIVIKNIDRLTHRLDTIANMQLKDIMVQATSLVHAQAKLLAPVDTGNLAGSIHMTVKSHNDTLEGRVYTNVQYAPYVEFGTGVRGNGTYPYDVQGLKLSYHESWTGMPAQPYMYPALKQNEQTIRKMFKDGVKKDIAKNCKGGQ